MATLTERKPGVWFARVFVPATTDGPARQVGRVFRGQKKSVRAEVAAWEAEIRGRAPAGVGATVADLLAMWQEAKAHEWQPTTVRDHRSRAALIVADLGSVRLLDLDPLRIDAWLAQLSADGASAAVRSGAGWPR